MTTPTETTTKVDLFTLIAPLNYYAPSSGFCHRWLAGRLEEYSY